MDSRNSSQQVMMFLAAGNSKNNAVKSVIQFEHFDVVSAQPTDHYFFNSNKSDKPNKSLDNNNANIMKEWEILRENLPDSIYVTVYETRIDLLRAVIVGPTQTPYDNGLFFFDILLPSDYPNQPPKVYYHSHGYHINPNLYGNGKVCLSLINTLKGTNSDQKWTQESTILQILVSILELVLNERPYFNEDIFVLSCKTMLRTLRKPPKHFEGFVAHHFRDRAASILAAIKDYHDHRVSTDHQSSKVISPKFKADLRRLHCDFKKVFPNVTCEPIRISRSTKNNVEQELSSSSSSSSSRSGGTNSEINNVEILDKPNRKGFSEKLVSSFGKCIME